MSNWTTLEHEALRHAPGDFEESPHRMTLADRPRVADTSPEGAQAPHRGWRPAVIARPASAVRGGRRGRPDLRIVL